MASSEEIEERVGHPERKWNELKARVQGDAVRQFADVQDDWLDVMWTLDAYRIARILPTGFKDAGTINRGKGNWFAELVSLLLHHRTHHRIGARRTSGASRSATRSTLRGQRAGRTR